MIVIESNVLITAGLTIASSVLSIIATIIVTRHFAKRRNSGAREQITEEDIQMERVKNEHRSEIMGFAAVFVFLGGIILVLVIMAFSMPNP